MDIISAYREVDTYRGEAAISGTTPKTVRRFIARHNTTNPPPPRSARSHNYDDVIDLVAKTGGRNTAKRLRRVGAEPPPAGVGAETLAVNLVLRAAVEKELEKG